MNSPAGHSGSGPPGPVRPSGGRAGPRASQHSRPGRCGGARGSVLAVRVCLGGACGSALVRWPPAQPLCAGPVQYLRLGCPGGARGAAPVRRPGSVAVRRPGSAARGARRFVGTGPESGHGHHPVRPPPGPAIPVPERASRVPGQRLSGAAPRARRTPGTRRLRPARRAPPRALSGSPRALVRSAVSAVSHVPGEVFRTPGRWSCYRWVPPSEPKRLPPACRGRGPGRVAGRRSASGVPVPRVRPRRAMMAETVRGACRSAFRGRTGGQRHTGSAGRSGRGPRSGSACRATTPPTDPGEVIGHIIIPSQKGCRPAPRTVGRSAGSACPPGDRRVRRRPRGLHFRRVWFTGAAPGHTRCDIRPGPAR